MADEMTINDAAMYEIPAWHGKGIVKGKLFTRTDAQTVMGWTVTKEQAFYNAGGAYLPVPNTFLTVRNELALDNPARVLAAVGSRYEVVQNDSLLAFGDALTQSDGAAQWATAGSIRGGCVVYCAVKLPTALRVLDDIVEEYLLLYTSHDGSSPMAAMLTPVRVVCANTLSAAKAGKVRNRITVRHTASAADRVKQAEKLLAAGQEYYGALADMWTFLATTPVNGKGVKSLIEKLLPAGAGDVATRTKKAREAVEALFDGGQKGANQKAAKGTLYGLYNAAAEYADHGKGIRVTEGREADEVRAESVLFGSAASFKQTALDLTLALAAAPLD
jgi:phage/plasmid-like protein (TIGR03299 family)